jgi:CHAT domain-containing protein/tetratricopeptide (TPR) repeat protein
MHSSPRGPLPAGVALVVPALYLALALTAFAQSEPLEALATRLEAAQTEPERKAVVDEVLQARADLYKLVSEHATARFAKADFAGALKASRAALYLSTAAADDQATAHNLWNVGNALYRLNDLNGALDPLNQALLLSTKIGDRKTLADSLKILANCNLLLGRLDEAEQLEQRCIAAYGELGDKQAVAGMMVTLSTIRGEKGDQEGKAEILRRIIRESEVAGYDDVLARAVNNLGVVYYDQGDYERSLQYIQRSADLFTRLNSDPSMPAKFHNNIGVMHQFLGHDKEAFDEYAKAEAFAVEAGDLQQQMHIKNNRAALYRETGQPGKALEEIRVVSEYYVTSPLRTDALRATGEYAQTLLAAGHPEAAVSVATKALAEAREIAGPDIIRAVLVPLAEAYLRIGKRVEARAAFLEAIAAIESIKLAGREDEKENFFHEKGRAYQGMVRLAREEGHSFEALQYAERDKARLLLDVLRGERADLARVMTAAEKQRESELSTAVAKFDSQLAKSGGRAKPELLDQRIQSAIALDEFRQALYTAHPVLRLQRAEFQPIAMPQIVDLLLDNDTALIEFTVTRDAAYVFTFVRGGPGQPRLDSHELREPASLASDIEAFRAQLAAHNLDYRTTAQALYTRVFGQSAALLRGKKRLVIVPDGPLWNLPFQALLSPRGKHLVEESSVFYAPSLTAVHAMQGLTRGNSAPGRTLLAMAGLPETVHEAQQIGKLYGPQSATVFVGDRVDKERWKTEAPSYRILHLATHGVLSSNNPLSSYLVMNGDNVLTAREILKMNLAADMTVLSACEMARGRFRFGEGLIGMSWAFLVAGTPTTLVSQWKVDSASTSQLMVAFHRNLKVKYGESLSGRAEALRQAELELLASPQYKHPFYWAGFVMIGNGY